MLRQILQKSGPQQLVDDGRPFPQVCNTIGVSLSPDLDTPVPPTGASPSPQDIGAPPIEVVSSVHTGALERGKVLARGQDDRFGAPATSLCKSYVLRFRNGAFLHAYTDDGIYFVFDLQRARLFSIPPTFVADCFHGEVLTVLTNPDGSGIRRTLLDRSVGVGETCTENW